MYKLFYDEVMTLKEYTINNKLEQISLENRDIITSYLRKLKFDKSVQINKTINNKDLIILRNWVISAIEVFINMFDTEAPKSGVGLLNRKKK